MTSTRPCYILVGMTMYDKPANMNRLMDLAYLRDGAVIHTDESLILACLLKAHGKGRNSDAMRDVQRIMRDKNLEVKKNKKKE